MLNQSASIRVEHLTRIYPGKTPLVANDNLNFEVKRGEIFGLLGPNGAGKTTLVHQLLGLTQPTSGAIWLEGIDVVKQAQQVKRITGFLPQTGLPMRTGAERGGSSRLRPRRFVARSGAIRPRRLPAEESAAPGFGRRRREGP